MPPDSSEGYLSPAIAGRPTMAILSSASWRAMSRIEAGDGFQRHLDILAHRQRGKQRPVLEHHAPAGLDRGAFLGCRVGHVGAQHADLALRRRVQARDGAQKHRLAGARPAHDAEDLAAVDVEVEPLVHHVIAELSAQAAHLDHRLRRAFGVCGVGGQGHAQTPISEKKIENSASATMTAKIAATTEREVC
jgi:hypothetical protein